jgi:dUTP pyrophosphatase
MKIKIKKLSEKAVIPTRAKEDDVGYDLTATTVEIIDKGGYGYVEYGTDLAIEIPPGYGGFLFPRSSITKTGLWLGNSVGVVDPGYTGSVTARFKYIPGTDMYKIGDRVAQLVVIKTESLEFEETDELSETSRGAGGFGSSGS